MTEGAGPQRAARCTPSCCPCWRQRPSSVVKRPDQCSKGAGSIIQEQVLVPPTARARVGPAPKPPHPWPGRPGPRVTRDSGPGSGSRSSPHRPTPRKTTDNTSSLSNVWVLLRQHRPHRRTPCSACPHVCPRARALPESPAQAHVALPTPGSSRACVNPTARPPRLHRCGVGILQVSQPLETERRQRAPGQPGGT